MIGALYIPMSTIKITPTVSSLLTQKTLEGFHPARGMVMTHLLPIENHKLKDMAKWMAPRADGDHNDKAWYLREAAVNIDALLAILANRMGYEMAALAQGDGRTGRLGHVWTVYRQNASGPLLIHWVIGDTEILLSVGTVGRRCGVEYVIMMLGNPQAHMLMQQFAADLRPIFTTGANRRVGATLDRLEGWDNLGFSRFELDHCSPGVFEANGTMLLDADTEPSDVRLEDYLELMYSVELFVDSPQEKLGFAPKRLKCPGQMILSAGKELPAFYYETNKAISWEIKNIIHAKSAQRVQELMSLMFDCEFKL